MPIELPCIKMAVTNALQKPTHVEKSYSNSYVYVDKDTANDSGDPLRVPVKGVTGTLGRVKTIYFASTGDREVIWRREDV